MKITTGCAFGFIGRSRPGATGVVLAGFVALAMAFFKILSANSPVGDVPCTILGIDDHGRFTVSPYVKGSQVVRGECTAALAGVGLLGLEDTARAKEFIHARVLPDFITAGLDEDGNLEILYFDKLSSTEETLNRRLYAHLRRRRP